MRKEQVILLLVRQPGDGEVRIETHPKCQPPLDGDGIASHSIGYVGIDHDNEGKLVIVATCATTRSNDDGDHLTQAGRLMFWEQCK